MTVDCSRTETNVFLNVQELGVILSALQLLDHSDEHLIARQYGPAPVLYNRLVEIYETLDRSQIYTHHEYQRHEHSY
jgi:hypothetical protein